jgi:hypothetical protein
MTVKAAILLLLLLAMASPGLAGTLVWVELPGARAATVARLIGEGFLPWLSAASTRGELHPIDPSSASQVDSIRLRLRRDPGVRVIDIGWRGRPAEGEMILSLESEPLEKSGWDEPGGGPAPPLLDAWRGQAEISDFLHVAGLDEALRWEEVLEFASLTDRQTRLLASMPETPGHPLWQMRHAYAVDRLFANAAIYYGRDRRPDRLFLSLGLAGAYEDRLLPWTESTLAVAEGGDVPALEREDAARILFLRRLRSSAPRVYGRVDRVLQSLQAEIGGGAFLVVDATESDSPFLVMAGGVSEVRSLLEPVVP